MTVKGKAAGIEALATTAVRNSSIDNDSFENLSYEPNIYMYFS